jgi:uncharacterized protein (DUF2141 family)
MRAAIIAVLAGLTTAIGGSARSQPAAVDPYAAVCRPNEHGPALEAQIIGLRDRIGTIRIELYPPNDPEFLSNSRLLVDAGKDFRRVEMPVPASGPVTLCIRAPHAGDYAVSVLHDRHRIGKFNLMSAGAGFGNNPQLGFSQPKAMVATMAIGPGVTTTRIVLNYFHGLAFGPLNTKE